jgi:hypothetical protein
MKNNLRKLIALYILQKNPFGIPIGISIANWPKFRLEPIGNSNKILNFPVGIH